MGRHETPAVWKWAALGVGVFALEAAKGETLSTCFRRGLENPHTRPLLVLGMVAVVGHLMEYIPPRYDVFDYLGHAEQLITERIPHAHPGTNQETANHPHD